MRTDLAGLKIRAARKQRGITQGELARQAGISASYLNLIEQNKRPIAGALLSRIAAGLGVERAVLDGEAERRIVEELREISVDPAISFRPSGPEPAEELVGRYPGWADLLLGVYRAYQQRHQDVLALADRLNRDPFLGESVHRVLTKVASIRSAAEILEMGDQVAAEDRARFLSIIAGDSAELSQTAQALVDFFENADTRIRAGTPTEYVDAFLFEAQNHFPDLEDFAEACLKRQSRDAIITQHWKDAPPGQASVPAQESLRFQSVFRFVERDGAEAVGAILDQDRTMVTEDARNLAEKALNAYAAAAILMPYAPFLEAAERHRYDLDILTRLFGVSYEQAAHRLVTLRRPGAEGPRFAFMRSDASGFITKRLPLPRLPLPRYGHACPLWVVYGAFQTPGITIRNFGELPSGEEFLFFARAVDKHPPRAGAPRQLLSIMLACSALDASRVAAGDGIDPAQAMIPLGTTCRLCPRAACDYRQEQSLAQ